MLNTEFQKFLSEKYGCDIAVFSMGVVSPTDPADGGSFHQVLPEGKFGTHMGRPVEFRESHFEQIKANAQLWNNDIVVDYEHNTQNPFVDKAPAAGWADPKSFDVRDTEKGKGLFVRIKWTQQAKAHIAADEYRQLSAVVIYNFTDPKTDADIGMAIPTIALTNTPYFDDMPNVHFSLIPRSEPKPKEQNPMNELQFAALCQTLGLAATSTPDQVLAACAAQNRDLSAFSQINAACGIEEGSSTAAILAAVKGLKESKDRLTEQMTEFSALAEEAKKVKAADRVTKAKAAGKIVADNEAWASELALSDPQAFDAWEKCAPKIVPVDPKDPPVDDGGDVQLTDAQKFHADQLGIPQERYAALKDKRRHSLKTAPAKPDSVSAGFVIGAPK